MILKGSYEHMVGLQTVQGLIKGRASGHRAMLSPHPTCG